MVEAFDPDAIQTPARIVAPDLVLDRFVAEETAYDSPLGLPAGVDLHLIGDRRRSVIVIECGRALKQPAAVVRPAATRRRGPVGRAASMPRIRSTSRSRHRIGRALEPLGMIALHADLLGERAPDVAGRRASVRQSRRSPTSAATRGLGAPAHCRRRGRCSGTCASRASHIRPPIPARAGSRPPAHRRAGAAQSAGRNGVVALMMYFPKPIAGARSIARRCASTTSSIATRRNRYSFAFALSSA